MYCDPLLQSGCLVADSKLNGLNLAHEMAMVIVACIVEPQYATVVTLVCGMVDISQVIKGMTGVHTKLDVQHNRLQKISRDSFVPRI